jgi:hypothetical protein
MDWKPMNESKPRVEETHDAELAHDALWIGIDGEEAVHYWSIYEQTVYVIEDGDVERWALADTPLATLGDWMAHTETKRGPWREASVSSGIVADLEAAIPEAGV